MIRQVLTLTFTCWAALVSAEQMRMAATTSFENSGLADVLLNAVEEDLGLQVQLLVVGTGQALRLGAAGDVDAVLVHARPAEDAFVEAGHGTHRREIMYNDFVIVGPESDPAGIAEATTALDVVSLIASQQQVFVSRGDDSGTHKAEMQIWNAANFEVDAFGPWYRAVGAGMGAALNTASAMEAYILSDRASWLKFGNKGNLALLFSGDPALFNQYSYLPVNPAAHPTVRHDLANQLEDWLTGPRAASLIDSYEIEGQKLFTFNATTSR